MNNVLVYMALAVMMNGELSRRVKDAYRRMDDGNIYMAGIGLVSALCVFGLQVCLAVAAAKEIWR